MKRLNVLITGADGFLGSRMEKYLEKDDKYNVFTINHGRDLTDYKTCLSITQFTDWVYHFAANMGGIGYFSNQNWYPPIENYLIDLNMIRACEENKVKRFFYPCSACAYPIQLMNSGVELEETMIDLPASPDQMYGWEKLSILKLLRCAPFDTRVGILHTIYGPGQAYEGVKAKFPPQIAHKVLQSVKTEKIEVWGDGEQTRTFLFVDDAIKMIHKVMSARKYWGEVNIGSSNEVSVNDIVKLCCTITGARPKIVYLLDKPTGPVRRNCSNSKFRKHYNYRPRISLKQGFTAIIKYIQNGK